MPDQNHLSLCYSCKKETKEDTFYFFMDRENCEIALCSACYERDSTIQIKKNWNYWLYVFFGGRRSIEWIKKYFNDYGGRRLPLRSSLFKPPFELNHCSQCLIDVSTTWNKTTHECNACYTAKRSSGDKPKKPRGRPKRKVDLINPATLSPKTQKLDAHSDFQDFINQKNAEDYKIRQEQLTKNYETYIQEVQQTRNNLKENMIEEMKKQNQKLEEELEKTKKSNKKLKLTIHNLQDEFEKKNSKNESRISKISTNFAGETTANN